MSFTKKDTILITGGGGQLAHDLAEVLKPHFKIFAPNRKKLDIADQWAVSQVIKKIGPLLIINTAAFCNVEECEAKPAEAIKVNALGAFYIARAAAENSSVVIYVSTDYVFDGSKKSYNESDCPKPINVYGVSKLAGEQLTAFANPAHYIIRTSALFGSHKSKKGNFVANILVKGRRGDRDIKVVNNLFTCPTYTLDLAAKIRELINKKPPFGIYHITNRGSCSWFQLAKKAFDLEKVNSGISPVKYSHQFGKAKRPEYSVLNNGAIKKVGLKSMPKWQDATARYLAETSKKSA